MKFDKENMYFLILWHKNQGLVAGLINSLI